MTATVEPRTLTVIECAGSAHERGRAQGEALRATIGEVLGRWRAALEIRHGRAADAYIAEFLAATHYLPAIEHYTPGLLAEVRGMAEGSGLPFETILAYNLMDEEWAYGESRRARQPGCTVACLVSAGGTPVIAQTMDIPSLHDGSQVAVRHRPENGPETVIFTGAGMLALNGANAAGVGVVVNNLSMLPSSGRGLPVMFVIRGILERTTLADATAFVERTPHAIGQHYAIGSPQGVVGLEGAANAVKRSDVGRERYVHANHPLAHGEVVGDPARQYRASRTFERQARAEELIADVDGQNGIEALLADTAVPISREPRAGFMTFGGTSIACSAPPVVRIAPGPPHLTPWTDIAF
jgi:isopenicillin-N N-acyltransferase-like protein